MKRMICQSRKLFANYSQSSKRIFRKSQGGKLMEEKVIYAKWLAFELRKQGFKLIRTDVNENFP